MNFDAVIGQIKAAAPVFSGNVAGAAGYARAIEDQAWLPMPAAYVVPTDEEPAENDEAPGLFQLVRERFEVIVIFDNTADRRGQSVTATYESTKAQLFAAILNWRPESTADNPLIQPGDPNANRSAKGLSYAGGTLVNFDRARLFYSWSFALQTAISDADGWQPPSDPLAHILLTTPVTCEGNVNWTVGTVSDVAFDQSFPVPSPPLPFGPSPTLPATPDAATLAAALATETAARAAADADLAQRLVALGSVARGTFNFVQNVPAPVWTITHNLGRYPSVTIADSSGREVEGDVVYLSANAINVAFSAGFAGTAYLN